MGLLMCLCGMLVCLCGTRVLLFLRSSRKGTKVNLSLFTQSEGKRHCIPIISSIQLLKVKQEPKCAPRHHPSPLPTRTPLPAGILFVDCALEAPCQRSRPTQQQSLLKTSLLAQLPATAREPILAAKSEESDAVVLAVSVTSGQTLPVELAARSATSLPLPSSSKRGSQWLRPQKMPTS